MPKAKIVALPTLNDGLVVVTDEMLEAGLEELLNQSEERDLRLIAQAVYLAMEYQRRMQSHQPLRFHNYTTEVVND